jgi:5-methylcytosine-specific restriction endonuclease McrA
VWLNTFGEHYKRKCCVSWCSEMITCMRFEVGHNIPESKGGGLDINNLRPICGKCNKSMGNQYTIDEYSRLSNPAENPWNCFRCVPFKKG